MEIKKNKNKDVRNRRGLFFQIGMICSIGVSLFAFSWQSALSEDILSSAIEDDEIVLLVPNTDQKEELKQDKPEPLEKMKEKGNQVKAVSDTVYTGEPKRDTAGPKIKPTGGGIIATEKIDTTIYTVVAKMPAFPGGEDAMKKFIYSHFQFPGEAQEVGVGGRVYIEFIVDEYGKMTNIRIAKDDVGFGCGEEALRVIKLLGEKYTWTPGEQVNAKVRVRYRYPIIIKLYK